MLLARQPELIRRRQANKSPSPIAGRGLFFRYWIDELAPWTDHYSSFEISRSRFVISISRLPRFQYRFGFFQLFIGNEHVHVCRLAGLGFQSHGFVKIAIIWVRR